MKKLPENLKYTQTSDLWIRVEGEVAVVGITELFTRELGKITSVEIIEMNKFIPQYSRFGTVYSADLKNFLMMPVSGEIIEFNTVFKENPELIDEDPYEKAWIVKIKMNDASQLDEYLDGNGYKNKLRLTEITQGYVMNVIMENAKKKGKS